MGKTPFISSTSGKAVHFLQKAPFFHRNTIPIPIDLPVFLPIFKHLLKQDIGPNPVMNGLHQPFFGFSLKNDPGA
jgi:hypothetical protein